MKLLAILFLIKLYAQKNIFDHYQYNKKLLKFLKIFYFRVLFSLSNYTGPITWSNTEIGSIYVPTTSELKTKKRKKKREMCFIDYIFRVKSLLRSRICTAFTRVRIPTTARQSGSKVRLVVSTFITLILYSALKSNIFNVDHTCFCDDQSTFFEVCVQ